MNKKIYEYRVVTTAFDGDLDVAAKLNAHAREGFRVVSYVAVTSGRSGVHRSFLLEREVEG